MRNPEMLSVLLPFVCTIVLWLVWRYLHKRAPMTFMEFIVLAVDGGMAGTGMLILYEARNQAFFSWLLSFFSEGILSGISVMVVLAAAPLAVIYVLVMIVKEVIRWRNS